MLEPTDPELAIVRMHGRNTSAWNQSGAPNWREVRYLYRYSGEELAEWAEKLGILSEKGVKDICMIFNNNSGGDAAPNGRMMMELLGQQASELPPEQMDLF